MKKHKGRPTSYAIEFFLAHAPVGTPLAVMVRTAGVRWKIEEDNKTAKNQPTRSASGPRGIGTSRCAC
jgi:SRSO17 transposase